MKKYIIILVAIVAIASTSNLYAQSADVKTDPVAENMLVYQRSVGGWPKAVKEVKVDYTKALTADQKITTRNDSAAIDATIDNNATSREINYLVAAFKQTGNKTYLASAQKGIRYLLKAQYANGGWPQYYPDNRLYRGQITFNDNAMINVMDILYNVSTKTKGFEVVDQSLVAPAADAVKRGIDCIVKTQIKVNGKLTAWNQQYDKDTLKPVVARKFELVGLSASESADIVAFLIRMPSPSAAVKTAITSAVEWFNASKIVGYRFDHIKDDSQPSKKDAVVVADPNSTIWARYYDVDTNKPFFSGRDGIKRADLKEVENERRAGYAWYGVWPQKILDKQYPAWLVKNSLK